jgi:sec-independent protein translocase protein TatA
MFGNLGATEIILILLVILIFFGARKIPELAQGLGKGMREFRKAAREIQDDINEEKRHINEPSSTRKTEKSSSESDNTDKS